MIVLPSILFFSLNVLLYSQSMSSFEQDQIESSEKLLLIKNNKRSLNLTENLVITNRRKKEISTLKYKKNLTEMIPQNFFENNDDQNNFIIYAPIKGEQVYTRINYSNEASFAKKRKKITASNVNLNNKKIKQIKSKNSNYVPPIEKNELLKKKIFEDNNELEYLTKSKGVIPIPQRPKNIEQNNIFFTNHIFNDTKRVTLKKKLLNYYEQLSTTTLRSPTKSITKLTSLSTYNNKKNFNDINRPVMTADESLAQCCIKKKISLECKQICSFNEISDKTLVQVVLTNKCPNGELKQVFECANNGDDHTKCCYDQNVHLINNGQCMAFCSKTSTPITDILQYFMCLQVFEKIKNCYISNLNSVNYRMSSNSKFNPFRLLL